MFSYPFLSQDLNYMASLSHPNIEFRIMKGTVSAVRLRGFFSVKNVTVLHRWTVSPKFLKAMKKAGIAKKLPLAGDQQIFLYYLTWRICFMKNLQVTVLC